MHFLDLNDDVLSAIVSFLSSHDALALASTARRIHFIAKPHALSSQCFTSASKLRAFTTYALADIQNRLLHLRRLSATSSLFAYSRGPRLLPTVLLLADILENARNLTSIDLGFMEEIVSLTPRISSALTALPIIEELALYSAGPLTLQMVASLRSSVRSLTIEPLTFLGIPLLPSLKSLPHLRSLQLKGVERNSVILPHIIYRPLWPEVHTLDIKDSTAPRHAFVRAFPNVRRLKLHNVDALAEEAQSVRSGDDLICWPRLDHLSVSHPEDALLWGISCPVRLLTFSESLSNRRSERSAQALLVAQNTTPVIVSAKFEATIVDFLPELVQVAPRLRSLEVVLTDMKRCPGASDVPAWMDHVPPLLGSSKISLLRLSIVGVVALELSELEDDLLHQWSTRLAECVPSLRYLALSIDSARVSHHTLSMIPNTRWWKIIDEGGQRTPVPISMELGMRVAEYMDTEDFESILTIDGNVVSFPVSTLGINVERV